MVMKLGFEKFSFKYVLPCRPTEAVYDTRKLESSTPMLCQLMLHSLPFLHNVKNFLLAESLLACCIELTKFDQMYIGQFRHAAKA
jgi:hypothetical protein